MAVQDLTRQRQRVLWGALAVSCLLHMALLAPLYEWMPAPTVAPAPPLILHLIPPKLAAARSQPPVPDRPKSKRMSRQPDHAHRPRIQPVPARQPAEMRPSPEPTPAVPPTEDILSVAKRSAGAVDRALRLANPARSGLMQVPPNTPSTRLERGIAATAIPRTTTMQELTTSNGQRYTKVVTPTGTYCVWGRDPSQPATIVGTSADTMTRTSTCP